MANQDYAAEVVKLLGARAETLATCESLTAGLCAAMVATVPGASAVLRGGLITYATDTKASLANVPLEILKTLGPVSAQTVQAMAAGARERCKSTWAIALSGVAGPEKQDGHPVGEVWVAIDGGSLGSVARAFHFAGGRQAIREQAATASIQMLLEYIQKHHASSN